MICIQRQKKYKFSTKGFSLVEMLVYIAVLMLVTVGSIGVLFSMDDLFAKYRAEQLVFRSSITVLERILHDVRDASSVSASDYNNPGSLTLTGGDGTKAYSLAGDAVVLTEDGIYLGPLTSDDVTVSELRFYAYASTTEFIRVKITLSATIGESTVSRTFNAGSVLRGSYE